MNAQTTRIYHRTTHEGTIDNGLLDRFLLTLLAHGLLPLLLQAGDIIVSLVDILVGRVVLAAVLLLGRFKVLVLFVTRRLRYGLALALSI